MLQPRKSAREKTTVMLNMPHLTHLFLGSFGSSDIISTPMKGSTQDAIMIYMRWFWNRRR